MTVAAVKTRHRRARRQMVNILTPDAPAHLTAGPPKPSHSKSFPIHEHVPLPV
jgi:hypothetical protein